MFRSTSISCLIRFGFIISLGLGCLSLGNASLAQDAPQLPPRSLLKLGSQGNDVTELQGVLSLMGLYSGAIDGLFSEGTLTAVKRFQDIAGISADGVVGAGTWGKLLPPAPGEIPVAVTIPIVANPDSTAAPSRSSETPSEVAEPILRKGAEGAAVSELQQRLRSRGFYNGSIDGGFGDETEAAVKAAQRNAALEEDGIVGPATWAAIR